MSMGSGAAEGLQQVLQRLFLEAQQKQQMQMHAERLGEDARQADMVREVGMGRIGEDRRQFDTSRTDSMNAAAAEQEAAVKTLAGHEEFEGTLPEHLRGVFHASGHKRDFTPDQFTNAPLTYEQQDTRGLKQKQGESDIIQARELKLINARPKTDNDRLVQVMGPNGQPMWQRESAAVGQPAAQAARAVTGQERGVLAYYNRAKDASDTITSADHTGNSLEDRVSKMGVGQQLGLQYAPNMLQSADQQAYRQAQRSFTEARLRKESGAAIPTAEYENDAKTYFAQPGDTTQTIDLKRQKRQVVLDGLKFSSGKAYDEFYGGQPDGASAQKDPLGIRR